MKIAGTLLFLFILHCLFAAIRENALAIVVELRKAEQVYEYPKYKTSVKIIDEVDV